MHWKWVAGILVSVVITFFSFPPFPLGYLMLVGLVPVFIAMETAPTWKAAFFRTWLYVFIGNSAICFWVAHTMENFARLPAILSYASVFVLSSFEQSAWPILAALRFGVHKKLGIRPLFWTPLCLMVLEFGWPKIFPNTMGNVFYSVPWLRQLADITGVWGLTALIALTNEMVAVLILRSWPKAELKKHAAFSGLALLVAFSYAGWRYGEVQGWMKNPKDTMRVALIQPNINPVAIVRESRDMHAKREELARILFEMSKEAVMQKPDLIFWPETAIANSFHSQNETETFTLTKAIDDFFPTLGTPLLFGARDKTEGRLYNTLYYLTTQDGKTDIQRYHKHILLWLGESIPFSRQFPKIADYIARQGGTAFFPGEGPRLFDHPKAKLGSMICLEGLYASYVRDIVLTGADVLASATNDAWYGPGQEPDLHFYLTTFRAIETRRPIMRSTTTGYSGLVDIDGSVKLKTQLFEKQIAQVEVPVYPPITSPYLRWGNLLIYLAALWALYPAIRWCRGRLKRVN